MLVHFFTKAIKKVKFIHVFWVFFYLLLFGVLIYNGSSYLDPDFGWHLTVGQEIARTHAVPQANLYNYTYTGNWVDHEWLGNFILAKIYNNFGYNLIIIIFASLIILTMIILNIFTYAKGKTIFWLIAAFEALGVLASMPHFGIRLQELALLFTLLLLIIINYYTRSKSWKILIALPPLFFLWANLHASFLIGFFVLFSWIGIMLVENINFIKKIKWLDLSKTPKLKPLCFFTLAVIISFVSTLFTPYGLKLYSFLIGYGNNAYSSLIEEWLPQSALPLNLIQLLYLALGTTALLFYFYSCFKEKEKINIWKIFLPIIFLVMSFESKRHFPLFFIVSFGFMMEVYTPIFTSLKFAYSKYLKILIIICLGLMIFLQFSKLKPINNPLTNFCEKYPCGAINFLKENPQYKNYNIFNDYSWGGFLIWALPEKKLFIDGRLPQIAFSHWTFIEEYHDFFVNKNNLAVKLKSYNIKLILIRNNQEIYIPKPWEKLFFPVTIDSKNLLTEYLNESPDWTIIYQDAVTKLYFYNR